MMEEGIFFVIWLLFMIFVFVLSMFLFAFWVWMLVDAAKRNYKKENDKILWILVIVLAGWIGGLIYFIMIKSKDKKLKKK
ncbi:PLDc N-terminal domain-containing protein [Nanoarchaeota archaeon]